MAECKKCFKMLPGGSKLCDPCRYPNYPKRDLKRCTGCLEAKPITRFYACCKSPDGKSPECKDCHNKRVPGLQLPARRIHINVERLNMRERMKVLGLAVIYQAKLDQADDMTETDLEKWCYVADVPVDKTREALSL